MHLVILAPRGYGKSVRMAALAQELGGRLQRLRMAGSTLEAAHPLMVDDVPLNDPGLPERVLAVLGRSRLILATHDPGHVAALRMAGLEFTLLTEADLALEAPERVVAGHGGWPLVVAHARGGDHLSPLTYIQAYLAALPEGAQAALDTLGADPEGPHAGFHLAALRSAGLPLSEDGGLHPLVRAVARGEWPAPSMRVSFESQLLTAWQRGDTGTGEALAAAGLDLGPLARAYLGLLMLEGGDEGRALAVGRALAATPSDSPWPPAVAALVAAISYSAGPLGESQALEAASRLGRDPRAAPATARALSAYGQQGEAERALAAHPPGDGPWEQAQHAHARAVVAQRGGHLDAAVEHALEAYTVSRPFPLLFTEVVTRLVLLWTVQGEPGRITEMWRTVRAPVSAQARPEQFSLLEILVDLGTGRTDEAAAAFQALPWRPYPAEGAYVAAALLGFPPPRVLPAVAACYPAPQQMRPLQVQLMTGGAPRFLAGQAPPLPGGRPLSRPYLLAEVLHLLDAEGVMSLDDAAVRIYGVSFDPEHLGRNRKALSAAYRSATALLKEYPAVEFDVAALERAGVSALPALYLGPPLHQPGQPPRAYGEQVRLHVQALVAHLMRAAPLSVAMQVLGRDPDLALAPLDGQTLLDGLKARAQGAPQTLLALDEFERSLR